MTAQDPELSAALGWPGGISDPALDRKVLLQMVATLRLASQQALEALTAHADLLGTMYLKMDAITALRGALAQEQTEPDISRCPQCNGPADNGFDRSFPPSPYLCTKCMAEPVEPVAWECRAGGLKPLTQRQYDAQTVATKHHYTRIAPPQRTMVPLTEEEIDAEWRELDGEVSTMFMRVLRKFARAVEQASWEKNHGQA